MKIDYIGFLIKLRELHLCTPVKNAILKKLDESKVPEEIDQKVMMNWMEGELIGGDKVYYLDESHGVIISYYGEDGYKIKFAQRIYKDGKYYCRIVKRFEITPTDFNSEFDERF